MSGHYLPKRTRLGGWAWALASFSAMLLVVAILFFRREILDLQGLTWALLGVAALVVLALVLSAVAVSKAWRRGYRGGGRALAGLALACVVGLPFALGLALAFEFPTSSAARTEGIAAERAPGTRLASLDSSSVLLGADFRATAADVYSAARASIEASGWEIVEVAASSLPQPREGDLGVSGTVLVPTPTWRDTLDTGNEDAADPYAASDSDRYTISAVAYAPVFGFASDVTVWVAEVDGTSFVDLRSVSRDLSRDLGQNRRFIEGFLARLEDAMTLLQSGPGEAED